MRKTALRLMSGTAAAAIAVAAALAQDEEPVDEIIVTGTRIPRKDLTAPSPVTTISRDAMKAAGTTVVEDFLNDLPQITPDFGKGTNNPGDGTAAIDLRGLGRGRTLVLLNARRLAPASTGSAIDVNTIPAAMIERIEIVTGGASAVYGSDAVTGAVNFITRKDFTGVEISGQADIYGAGDGLVYNGSAAGGFHFSDEAGHVAAFVDYLKRKPVFQGDRAFSEFVLLEDGFGNLFAGGSPTVPAGRTLPPPQPSLLFNSDGTIRPFDQATDFYNFAPSNYLQTPLERWTGGVLAEYEVSPAIELYTELLYSRPSSSRELAPAPATFRAPLAINGPFFAASARPTLTARYDPDLDGIGFARVSKRFEDVGPRILTTHRENYRGLAGLRADLGASWSLDGFYSYARNETSERLDNAVSLARVLQGLLIDPATGACVDPSNGCVAVNIFGNGVLSAAGRDFVRADGLANEYSSIQHNAAIVASGDVFDWSERTIKSSAGVEFRRNIASSQADPALATGDALGFNPFAGAQGAIDVYEIFSELLVPVLEDEPFAESLEIEAGGRFSHYSTAGGGFTWKAGGQWVPVHGLRLKGMWQRAVRAPNVEELFQVVVSDVGDFGAEADFCRASDNPAATGLAPVCIAQGMSASQIGVYDVPDGDLFSADTFNGGNPALRVERAGSITAGFDYTFDTPFTLRVGADFFSIRIDDAVNLSFDPFAACSIVGDPDSDICRAIRRAPTGEPLEVDFVPLNLAVARAKGIDFSFAFAADVPRALGLGSDATIALQTAATYYLELGHQDTEKSPFIDCAGWFSGACASSVGLDIGAATTFPSKLATTTLTLNKGPFSGSARWRFIGAVDNLLPVLQEITGEPPYPLAAHHVGSRNYLDVSARLELFDNLTLSAGIDNVLKTKPPLLGDESFQANTDPRYDVYGRRFFIGASVRFGGG